jgi:hypothetical protein
MLSCGLFERAHGRLAAIGKAEPELEDEITQLINAMQRSSTSAGQSQPMMPANR